MLLVGLAIIGFVVFVVYKPMYSVSLNGEFIGYTEDKSKLQKKINTYADNIWHKNSNNQEENH